MNDVEHVISVDNELGEGPLWNVEEQTLYWVNITRGRFHKLHTASGQHERFEIGTSLGVLGFRAKGGLVMATQTGLALWDPQTQKLHYVAEPEINIPNSRFNDGAVDRQGRFWAGTMINGKEDGTLYRLDADLSLHKMETGVSCTNGIGWSLDNKTMYYTDSTIRTIYAYDFNPATGDIANRRVLIQTQEGDGVPDGLCIDSEGFIWSARWDGWKVSRFDPEGKLEREIKVPAAYVTSCAFGGPDLNELFITTAMTEESKETVKRTQPWAGDVFRARPGVTGLPAPKFAG
jgi:L-arabinonolactonase